MRIVEIPTIIRFQCSKCKNLFTWENPPEIIKCPECEKTADLTKLKEEWDSGRSK